MRARPPSLADDHLKPPAERADLPRSVRLHDLRHTYARSLLARVHPWLLQELLGHSSTALTLDRYSNWVPSMGEQIATAMDAALS